MGVVIKLRVEDKNMRAMLSNVSARLINLQPLFKDFGVHMVRSVATNFQAGGRPTSWPPSGKSSGKTLIKSGALSKVVYAATNQGVIIGTQPQTKDYAAIHQFGGTIRPTHGKYLAIPLTPEARRTRPRDMEGTFVIKSQAGNLLIMQRAVKQIGRRLGGKLRVVVKPQYLLRTEIKIPQRKFLLFQQEDREYLNRKGVKYIVSGQL